MVMRFCILVVVKYIRIHGSAQKMQLNTYYPELGKYRKADLLMNGWIKLHRKMLENPVVAKDSDYLSVWIYLLLNAEHDERTILFGGNKIILKPGQLITGRKSIAEFLQINESKVKRILIDFENDQQIDRQRSNKNSLISLKNWDKYQFCDRQNDQQVTNERPTSDQQVTTYQEVKKRKKDNNIYTRAFEEFWEAYPRKKDKGNAFKKFNARLNSGFSEVELVGAAKKYAGECERNQTEERYIKHAATFLSDKLPFMDYLEKGEIITDKTNAESIIDDEELVGDDW